MSRYRRLFGNFTEIHRGEDTLVVGCKYPLMPQTLTMLDIRFITAWCAGNVVKVINHEVVKDSAKAPFTGCVKIHTVPRS